MSDLKALANVRRTTEHTIILREFESVKQIVTLDNEIRVLINRAKSHAARDGYKITHRGLELINYHFSPGIGWQVADRFMQWWSTAELVHHAPPRTRDLEWEDLCHRPGSSRNPLDNLARKRQGYGK